MHLWGSPARTRAFPSKSTVAHGGMLRDGPDGGETQVTELGLVGHLLVDGAG